MYSLSPTRPPSLLPLNQCILLTYPSSPLPPLCTYSCFMQIPQATVRSLAQRPISLDDDEDDDDGEGVAAVDAAAAAAAQAEAEANAESFKNPYDASFAASSMGASAYLGASRKGLARSRSKRGMDDDVDGAKSAAARSGDNAGGEDEHSGPSFWTRIYTLLTCGRRRAKVSLRLRVH